MKKSYSPFKMWGSYVGAILLFIWNVYDSSRFLWYIGGEAINLSFWETLQYMGPSSIFSSIIFGFLIGWGIHSLIRRKK
jgi:hypothetical protein